MLVFVSIKTALECFSLEGYTIKLQAASSIWDSSKFMLFPVHQLVFACDTLAHSNVQWDFLVSVYNSAADIESLNKESAAFSISLSLSLEIQVVSKSILVILALVLTELDWTELNWIVD